jgi:hypothetical protein
VDTVLLEHPALVGIFHTVTRTILVTAAWYLAPHGRFVVIPAIIVGVYAVTIVILEQRWRASAAAPPQPIRQELRGAAFGSRR